MLIIGNSHVDIFRQSSLKIDCANEKLNIHWVGAIKIANFYKNNVVGNKVRSFWGEEDDWKFLCIGTHDIYELCVFASATNDIDRLNDMLDSLSDSYQEVFEDLSRFGKFGWIVFPPAVGAIRLDHFTEKAALSIAQNFNRRIKNICVNLKIEIIDPLHIVEFIDQSSSKNLIQQDGIHLNIAGAALYINSIKAVTKRKISFNSGSTIFEPKSELESFCNLLLGELGILKKVGVEINETNPIESFPPYQEDFYISMCADSDNPRENKKIIDADLNISKLNDKLFSQLHELCPPNSRDARLNYGIISYWYALNYARRGDYEIAIELITQSKRPNPKLCFPFTSKRADLHMKKWIIKSQYKATPLRKLAIKFKAFLINPFKLAIMTKIYKNSAFPAIRSLVKKFRYGFSIKK